MSKLQDELRAIDAEIKSRQAQASQLRVNASEWEAQSKAICKGTKSSKQKCENDNAMKASKAAGYFKQAASLDDISDLQATKAGIQKLIEAEATAQVKLAEQGKDTTSLRIVAEGTASADLESARITSAAQAESMLRTADANAETNKTRNMIFIIIGVVVALSIGVAIFLKIKKGKSKSKSKK